MINVSIALIKVILFSVRGFYGGFPDHRTLYFLSLTPQGIIGLGQASSDCGCELSIGQFIAVLRLKFSRMVLEKALTRPYTWHSLMESANNAAIKIFQKAGSGGQSMVGIRVFFNITRCF
jgi:hypothetical protein